MRKTVCEQRTYTSAKHTHDHDYSQLLLPLRGSMHIETTRNHVVLTDDHLFLIPPGCTHSFYSGVRNEILVLDIPSPAFTPQKESHLTLDKRWRALRFLFLEESKKGNGNAIDQLLPYVINALEEENQPSSIQYIHEHFRESISLNKLADLEHYHTAYYHRWFRKQTGMSTTKYIQTLRLKEAKRLLENTDLPIYRVAIEVGYNHQSSLTRLFLQHEKITPNVYRKQVRSG